MNRAEPDLSRQIRYERIMGYAGEMFRLAFIAALLLWAWLQSLCDTTIHTVNGDHHSFAYGWLAWAFLAAISVQFLAFSWVAWRVMDDRVTAGILLAGIPLIGVAVLPQTLCERVEITDELLIHRREPPHTEYNVDLRLDEIASVTEIRRESGSFSTYYAVGYEVVTQEGRRYELPSNTVMTVASDTVNAALAARNIPIETKIVCRPPPR